MKIKPWLIYASITTVTWGVWGALIEKPEEAGFPNTLGYIVWAILMMPNAITAFILIKGKLDVQFPKDQKHISDSDKPLLNSDFKQ